MSRVIQVFEFEKLTLYKDSRGRFLYPKELEKLYQFNDQNNHIYFTGIRDGVRFKNYVGVIQVGGLTVEILPKADKNLDDEIEYNIWHGALLNMLRVCRHINVDSISEANLRRKHNSILELYYEMYLDEVQQLIRAGLIKKYRNYSGNVYSLKGRLNFSKNIQKNLIHGERFYTEHQVYDYENIVNQILIKGLSVLSQLTTDTVLSDRINRIRMSFPEIREIEIQKSHFSNLVENRKTTSYQKAIQIARMIILNYSPDIKSGQEHMLTLLFDMNKLWEEYIYRMLIKSKRPEIKISFQNKQKFWEGRTIRPDLVIKRITPENEENFVIDTKWKILDQVNPKPSDDDLKQMYAYNLYWGATKSMLLYPNSIETDERFGNFWKGREIPDENKCKVGFINVLDSNSQLDFSIGDQILSKLF